MDDSSAIYRGYYLGLEVGIKVYNLNKLDETEKKHFISEITLFADEYNTPFIVVLDGYVANDQDGADDNPDNNTWFAVAVPDNMAAAELVE